jgi:hypothetical protein
VLAAVPIHPDGPGPGTTDGQELAPTAVAAFPDVAAPESAHQEQGATAGYAPKDPGEEARLAAARADRQDSAAAVAWAARLLVAAGAAAQAAARPGEGERAYPDPPFVPAAAPMAFPDQASVVVRPARSGQIAQFAAPAATADGGLRSLVQDGTEVHPAPLRPEALPQVASEALDARASPASAPAPECRGLPARLPAAVAPWAAPARSASALPPAVARAAPRAQRLSLARVPASEPQRWVAAEPGRLLRVPQSAVEPDRLWPAADAAAPRAEGRRNPCPVAALPAAPLAPPAPRRSRQSRLSLLPQAPRGKRRARPLASPSRASGSPGFRAAQARTPDCPAPVANPIHRRNAS